MRVIRRVRQMAQRAQALRRRGKTIGFVPTMGALHEGHASLIRAARRQTDVVVVSIFVNPLQFGPHEDYARYPRDLKGDVALATAAGADIVFAPSVRQLYPPGFCTAVEIHGLSDMFEGALRPGHFRGVATVVIKLFELIQPTVAYVGQKDYQQAVIIQRFVKDLHVPITIRVMPTVREPDGLAMSSRNRSLSSTQRRTAVVLFEALQFARARIQAGERRTRRLSALLRRRLAATASIRVEYVAIVNAATLAPLTILRGRVAVLVAIRLGQTRLIDNLLVDVS